MKFLSIMQTFKHQYNSFLCFKLTRIYIRNDPYFLEHSYTDEMLVERISWFCYISDVTFSAKDVSCEDTDEDVVISNNRALCDTCADGYVKDSQTAGICLSKLNN